MAGSPEECTELVGMVVRSLVDDPDAVSLESSDEDGVLRIEIAVAEDEVGKVIGRQGRVIKAIRTLARAAGSQSDLSVEVEIAE